MVFYKIFFDFFLRRVVNFAKKKVKHAMKNFLSKMTSNFNMEVI